MLALGPTDRPSVAYVQGAKVVVATRAGKAKWRRAAAASVPSGSHVMAFRVGASGPVVLVQTADDKNLFLVRRRNSRWQRTRIAGGLPAQVQLGWPGLALDGHGLPVVAYTRWNAPQAGRSQLMLVRINARGRTRSVRITAEGFPQSEVAPPAAPVFVKGRVHVIESFGYRTQVGTIEWYPDRRTWTGLFIDAGRGDFPIGPVFAGRNGAGTLYAAWTESMIEDGAAPVTLAVRAAETVANFVLDRALTTALALSPSGPEIAANAWVEGADFGLSGANRLWAGTVVSRTRQVELDGWIAGLAVGPRRSREVLLARPEGLAWYRARSALATRVTIRTTPRANGGVTVSGEVQGVSSGRVTVYRERLSGTRTVVGQASISNGSFSLVDRSPVEPLLYRVVYTDPATDIPYAALLRPPPPNPFPDGEDDG